MTTTASEIPEDLRRDVRFRHSSGLTAALLRRIVKCCVAMSRARTIVGAFGQVRNRVDPAVVAVFTDF